VVLGFNLSHNQLTDNQALAVFLLKISRLCRGSFFVAIAAASKVLRFADLSNRAAKL